MWSGLNAHAPWSSINNQSLNPLIKNPRRSQWAINHGREMLTPHPIRHGRETLIISFISVKQ